MDQRRVYGEEPRPPAVRTPKAKLPSVTPIAENKRYADAVTILRMLETGQQQIREAADALRIDDYLLRRPQDPRAAELKARLKKHQAATPQKAPESTSDLPPAVVTALQLLTDGKRPAIRNRRSEIARLEADEALVEEAIRAQRPIVDSIRGELIVAQAGKDRAAHDTLVLAQYRAAQALASATDALAHFRSSRLVAGYAPWPFDLLPEPLMRAAVTLGSEDQWDSEICRVRRALEELKIL